MVLTGSKMRRHGLFLSAEEKIKDQALNKQLDINANLRKTSEHEISSNKKCYQKHGKHIFCSKTIILLLMHLVILSVNKCLIDCDASPIPASSDILLDTFPSANENIKYGEPYRLTPIFPTEESTGKRDEDIEEDSKAEDTTNVDWRYWPTISSISDDNDALSRFMWPQGFMSAYHSPRRNEISSLFRNPFTKRAARGHLRFVKPRYYSRRSAKTRRSAATKPTIQDLLKVLELKLKELQLIVKRAT